MKSLIEGLFKDRNWSDRTGYADIPAPPPRRQPAGQAGQAPPAGQAGQVPPAGQAGQVPPAGQAGQVPPAGQAGQVPPAGQAPPVQPTYPNLEIDHCARLHGWQTQIVNLLKNPEKKDYYVLSQPGSGKTAPVICHWVNNILGISTNPRQRQTAQQLLNLIRNPQDIPQVLWLVPIRNLNINIAEEMIERFVDIIFQILNMATTVGTDSADNVNKLFFINPDFNIVEIINAMGRFGKNEDRLLKQMLIRDKIVPNHHIREFKTVLGQLTRLFVENALVGRIQEGLNSAIANGSPSFYKPFIISIYESARHVISKMDKLRLIVFDESQRVQGGDESDDRRAAEIGNSIHTIFTDRNGKNAQLIMLSGSTSRESASNLTAYFNTTYGRRFDSSGIYQTPENITNPADIRVFPMANLDDKYTQLRIIQTALAGGNLRKSGIVFIIFGKNKINQLLDQLAPSEVGYIVPGKNLPKSTSSSMYSRSDLKQINKPGDINDIRDDRLRRAASRGIGYLYRPEELTPEREKDTIIIQNLFREGVIRVLFATDAVREGMNITCKEMYIPTILNPSNGKKMEPGSLAQLINRAGRKEDIYTSIYTDPQFVADITYALSKDPRRFGEEPLVFPSSPDFKFAVRSSRGILAAIEIAKMIIRHR